jgi:8-oxo-dGTP diphosphatase
MGKVQHDSEVLAAGQQVISACAFIHHNFDGVPKLFMAKRANTKKFLPGVFELPGGHIDYGEQVADGLAREIDEEFGMQVSVGDPFVIFTYENDIKQSHSLEAIYFATFTSPLDTITLEPEDHSEYRWVSEEELPSIFTQDKDETNDEIKAIRHGFALLKGEKLDFGSSS